MEDIKNYIEKEYSKVIAGSPLYQAMTYFINQYRFIKNYLKEGFLEIDNNKAENVIRPFALGRKNWLFVGDEQGGTASSIIYSLIASAKANNLEPSKYLQYLFDNINKTEQKNLIYLLPHKINKTKLS